MTVFSPTPPSKPFRCGAASGDAVPLEAACQTATGVPTPDLSATPPTDVPNALSGVPPGLRIPVATPASHQPARPAIVDRVATTGGGPLEDPGCVSIGRPGAAIRGLLFPLRISVMARRVTRRQDGRGGGGRACGGSLVRRLQPPWVFAAALTQINKKCK